MRILLAMAACLALASAELYKETEDFQYTRTSSDDGEKKGFYESQRGNMGGNFEVSHNMDNMAKGQLNQLAHTVRDQLGVDPTGGVPIDGSIYGSASTSGNTYGTKKVSTTNAHDLASGNSWSDRYDTSRGSTHGTGGRRSQGRIYNSEDSQARSAYGHGNQYTGSAYHTDSSGTNGAQILSVPASTIHTYDSASSNRGSSWSAYEEKGSQSNTDRRVGGGHAYVMTPVNGVREAGRDSSVSGSHYSQSGQTYHGGQVASYGTDDRATITPTVARPQSTVRIAVRPDQNIPIRIPIQLVPAHGIQTEGAARNTYVSNSYGRSSTAAESTGSQREQTVLLNAGTAGSAGATGRQGSAGSVGNAGRTGSVDNVGNVGGAKSYQSSYSYKKNWETHGGTPETGGQRMPVRMPSTAQVTDLGAAAQNRDRLMVVGVELDNEDHGGSTTFNSGSRVASTRNEGYGSTNMYREAKGDSGSEYHNTGSRQTAGQAYGGQSNGGHDYGSESSHRNAGGSYHSAGRVYNPTQTIENQGSQYENREIYENEQSRHAAGASDMASSRQTVGWNADRLRSSDSTDPKNYQSSYSYRKSWEKHGDPYVIIPTGTITDNYGSNAGTQNHDLSSMVNREQNSRYSSGSTSSLTAGGSSLSEDTATSMAAMQEKLRSQMGQVHCPGCNQGATKGYSATYSYGSQRRYGGAEDTGAVGEGRHRYKRHSPMGYNHHNHHDHHDYHEHHPDYHHTHQYQVGGQPAHMSSHFHHRGHEPKYTSRIGHSYSSSISGGHDSLYPSGGKGVLLVKLSPGFTDENVNVMEKEMHGIGDAQFSGGDGHRTSHYTQTGRHYGAGSSPANGHRDRWLQYQHGDSVDDPIENMNKKSWTTYSLETPEKDKSLRTHGYSSTAYYTSHTISGGKLNEGKEVSSEVEAQGSSEKMNKTDHQILIFSDTGKQLKPNTIHKDTIEDFKDDSDKLPHAHSQFSIRKSRYETGQYKTIGEEIYDETENKDMGQKTHDFSNSRNRLNGQLYPVDNKEFTGREIGSSGQRTQGSSTSSSHYITSDHYYGGKQRGQEKEDFGQETQGFLISGSLPAKPHISSGNLYMTEQETENLGQPEKFPSAHVTNGKKPKNSESIESKASTPGNLPGKPQLTSGNLHVTEQETEDMGQETQNFSTTYGKLEAIPQLSTGNLHVETEDLGQQTQDFSETTSHLGSSSGFYDMTGQETEDMGQETQDFSETTSHLGSSLGFYDMTGQETEDMGQETQDFSTTHGKLEAKPHISSGSLHFTGQETEDVGQETQGFSGSDLYLSSGDHYSNKKPISQDITGDMGQERESFVNFNGNLQGKPQNSIGKLDVTGQETQSFVTLYGTTSNSHQSSGKQIGQEPKDNGQETQSFSGLYGNSEHKPHLQSGNLHATGQETEDMSQQSHGFFESHSYLNPSTQHSSGKLNSQGRQVGKLETTGDFDMTGQEVEDVGQETQSFYSTYGNLQNKPKLSTGSLYMTGQETEDLGQQTEDMGQETQNFAGSGLYFESSGKYSNGNMFHGQESENMGQVQDLGQETQSFTNYGKLTAGSHRSTGQLEMTGQETEDLGQQTQGFSSGGLYLGSSGKLHVGQESGDVGQETQNFATSYGSGLYSQQPTGNFHMTGQETEDLGQGTQNFGSSYRLTHHSTGGLQMTGQETEDLGQQTYSLGQQPSGFRDTNDKLHNEKSYSQSNMAGPKLQISNQQGKVGLESSDNSNVHKPKLETASKPDIASKAEDKEIESHLGDLFALLEKELNAATKEMSQTVTSQTIYKDSPNKSGNEHPEPKISPFNVNFTMEFQGDKVNRAVSSGDTSEHGKPLITTHNHGYHKPTELNKNVNNHEQLSFLETYSFNSGKPSDNTHSGRYTAESHNAGQVNADSSHAQKPVIGAGSENLNFAHQSYDAGQQVEQTVSWHGDRVEPQRAHIVEQQGKMNAGNADYNLDQLSSHGSLHRQQQNPQIARVPSHQHSGGYSGQFTIGGQQQLYQTHQEKPVTTTPKLEVTSTTEAPGWWTKSKEKAKSWFS